MLNRLITVGVLAGMTVLGQTGSAAAVAVAYTDFSAFQSASGSLTTESFDAAPWMPDTVMTQPVTNLGVTWTAVNELFAFSSIVRSPTTAITSGDNQSGPDTFDWIEALLPNNTTAVGGWVTSFSMAHDTTLFAYDSDDNLLGSVSLDNTGEGYEFLGLITDTAIAKVRLASINVTNPIGDDFALDDFSFGAGNATNPDPTPVPEPGTLALFGAGLAGLGLLRRKRPAA